MMRRICLAAVLLMFVLSSLSCVTTDAVKPSTYKNSANKPTFILHFDKNIKSIERAMLFDAFKIWERDTLGTVRFIAVDRPYDSAFDEIRRAAEGLCTYDVYVMSVLASASEVKRIDARENTKILGYTTSSCAFRTVSMVTERMSDPKLYRQVAVHEAGHLIGLDHIPVPKESVMFPTVDKATSCLSVLDMKQFCMIYNCDWRAMKPCDSAP